MLETELLTMASRTTPEVKVALLEIKLYKQDRSYRIVSIRRSISVKNRDENKVFRVFAL